MTPIRVARFFLLFVAPNIIFAIVVLALPAAALAALLNGVLVALSAGVCVAYFPVIHDVLTDRRRPIDRADFLALGIFCSWFAISMRAGWSLLWRYNGQPHSWIDQPFIAYFIYLSVCGAAFHLLAPGVIASRVPSREWVHIGILSALGVLSIFLASWLLDAFPLR